jgi:hypothetical protein
MFLTNLNAAPAKGAEGAMAKYSIVYADWSPRPAYTAIQEMLTSALPEDTARGTGTFAWPSKGRIADRFGLQR